MVQIVACRWPGDRPLSELLMVGLLTHICVTRPQWFKWNNDDFCQCHPWTKTSENSIKIWKLSFTKGVGNVVCKMRVHYNDVIMGMIASQITSLTIVYSTVYPDADQRKHQSSASLDFVRGIHRWIPRTHKWPVTRKMFPFDDVIMSSHSVVNILTGICIDNASRANTILKFDFSFYLWPIIHVSTMTCQTDGDINIGQQSKQGPKHFPHQNWLYRFAPSQWETALLCNDVSHWLGARL